MITEVNIQSNRVDRTANGAFSAFWHGAFSAFWHGAVAYENGRVKRFETESNAWEYLARCDLAGKIIH
jgi:hypothetical protein